jgi:hypothetical protein
VVSTAERLPSAQARLGCMHDASGSAVAPIFAGVHGAALIAGP